MNKLWSFLSIFILSVYCLIGQTDSLRVSIIDYSDGRQIYFQYHQDSLASDTRLSQSITNMKNTMGSADWYLIHEADTSIVLITGTGKHSTHNLITLENQAYGQQIIWQIIDFAMKSQQSIVIKAPQETFDYLADKLQVISARKGLVKFYKP